MSEFYGDASDSEDTPSSVRRDTILVTGGSGLIGRALQREAHGLSGFNWVFLSSKDGDLRDPEVTAKLFHRHQPDYVIHLAARVGGLYRNLAEKVGMYEDNMAINHNVIYMADKFNVKRTVLCLSTCVFPDNPPPYLDNSPKYPFSEDSLHDGPPHPSNEGYAYAKRMMEVQARLYNEKNAAANHKGGPQFLCVIPTNVYGRHDNFHLEDSHVIPGLIHRCYLAKRDGTKNNRVMHQFM